MALTSIFCVRRNERRGCRKEMAFCLLLAKPKQYQQAFFFLPYYRKLMNMYDVDLDAAGCWKHVNVEHDARDVMCFAVFAVACVVYAR